MLTNTNPITGGLSGTSYSESCVLRTQYPGTILPEGMPRFAVTANECLLPLCLL